jgi:Mce-associated membrane protein
LVTLIAAAVVVALVATTVILGLAWRHGTTASHARHDAREAAVNAVKKVLSYDYRRFDADVAQADRFLTSAFRADYNKQQAQVVKATAVRYHATTKAEVLGAGLVSGGGNRASVLLFVDQTSSNTRLSAPRVDKSRVVAEMRKVGGRWLCAGISPL